MRRDIETIAKVLELKERRREEIAVEVKRIEDRIFFFEAELSELERSYLETFSAFDRMGRGGAVAAHAVGLYYGYMLQLLREIEGKKNMIARCLDELRARRGDLVEALKETRVLETLRERRLQERDREEKERERKETEFFALSRGRVPG